MRDLAWDLRFALRQMRRSPLLASGVILSLGLAIGFATGLFSMVDAVFFQPLPVEDAECLMSIYTTQREDARLLPVSFPDYEDLVRQSESFSSLTVFQAIRVSLGTGERPEQVWGQAVRWNFFDVLGVDPVLGRGFLPEEDADLLAHPVVVVSHGLWRRTLGADPEIVGKTIQVNGREFTVVGVAPPGFRGTGKHVDFKLWVPLMMHPLVFDYSEQVEDRSWQLFRVVGRLLPGVTLERARSELQTIAARLRREHPAVHEGHNLVMMPLRQAALGVNSRSLYLRITALLSSVAGLLLLIASTNVTSLLIARSLGRSEEMAVRHSLGSGRFRLARQLIVEGLVLSLSGAAAGLGIAALLQGAMRQLQDPRLPDSVSRAEIDHRVLLFALSLAVLSGLLLGIAPALQTSRKSLSRALSGRSSVGGLRRVMWGLRVLIGVQVALAFLSLTGAGLFLRSLDQIRRVEPGFDADNLVMLSFNLNLQGYDRASAQSFYERALEQVSALPGVERAALSENRLLSGLGIVRSVLVEGREPPPGQPGRLIRTNSVSLGYFRTVSIPILEGRGFRAFDHDEARRVAIVNRTMAERFWPEESPLGKRIRFAEDPERFVEVVGVAEDAKYTTLTEEAAEYIYLPMKQSFTLSSALVARVPGHPAASIHSVTSTVQALDANLPLVDPTTGPQLIHDASWGPRMAALILLGLGMVSLLLAGLGVYSIAYQAVEQRRHEIGVRIALGAERGHVLRLVLEQIGKVVLLGVGAGILLVLGLRSWFLSLLYGGWEHGWIVCCAVGAGLGVVAIAASLAPAVRGMRVNPTVTLQTNA